MPFGYWESCDARQWGSIVDIKENGLCVRSLVDMNEGAEVKIGLFLSLGNEFDRFDVLARVIGKDVCCQEGWESFQYELEFIGMPETDRLDIWQTSHICS